MLFFFTYCFSASSEVSSVEAEVTTSFPQSMLKSKAAYIFPEPIQICCLVGVSTRDYPHNYHSFGESKRDPWFRKAFQLRCTPNISVVGTIIDE